MAAKMVDLGYTSSTGAEIDKYMEAGQAKCKEEIVTWAHMRGWESSINEDGYFEYCKE